MKAAIWAIAAFATFALSGLWLESIQTLALMIAAVSLSLLVGIPLGIAAGRSDRFNRVDHAGSRRHADHPGVRIPDADRDPLLSRAGRRRDHDDDLRDPPRDPDHRARHPRRPGKHGRGRAGDGLDEATDPAEGAAAARTTDAAARRQPDDYVRSLDGRHCRADRRQGPRRRRDERAELVPRARDPRRDRRSSSWRWHSTGSPRPSPTARIRHAATSPRAPTPPSSRLDRDGGGIGGGSCRRPRCSAPPPTTRAGPPETGFSRGSSRCSTT